MINRHFPDQIINRTRRWPRDIAKQSPSYILGCSPTQKRWKMKVNRDFCPINISWCLVLTGMLAHPNVYCEVMQPAEIVTPWGSYCWWKKSETTTWDVKNYLWKMGHSPFLNWFSRRISEPSTVLDAVGKKKLGMDFSCFTSNPPQRSVDSQQREAPGRWHRAIQDAPPRGFTSSRRWAIFSFQTTHPSFPSTYWCSNVKTTKPAEFCFLISSPFCKLNQNATQWTEKPERIQPFHIQSWLNLYN